MHERETNQTLKGNISNRKRKHIKTIWQESKHIKQLRETYQSEMGNISNRNGKHIKQKGGNIPNMRKMINH